MALLVLAFGLYFAGLVRQSVMDWCRSMGIGDADFLSRIACYGIVTFALLTAIDHIDIGGGLVQQIFLILPTGIVLASAFGIGGRDRGVALLAHCFPRRNGGDGR